MPAIWVVFGVWWFMDIKLTEVLPFLVLIGSFAFGYGTLDARVADNAGDISKVEGNMAKRDEMFLQKFDTFLIEQRGLNRQIVENTANQKHILKKLELNK